MCDPLAMTHYSYDMIVTRVESAPLASLPQRSCRPSRIAPPLPTDHDKPQNASGRRRSVAIESSCEGPNIAQVLRHSCGTVRRWTHASSRGTRDICKSSTSTFSPTPACTASGSPARSRQRSLRAALSAVRSSPSARILRLRRLRYSRRMVGVAWLVSQFGQGVVAGCSGEIAVEAGRHSLG